LSIWTHWLKVFEFLPEYSIGEYRGMAARVGAGLESWELFAYMAQYNMTVLVAGSYTVGAYGGWMLGGGHSALASTYGMGADQVLSLDVVTADGRFVTADVNQNTDLFFALRGGGGSKRASFSHTTSPLCFRKWRPTNTRATRHIWHRNIRHRESPPLDLSLKLVAKLFCSAYQ
jgi:hypothetical protein